MSGLSREGGVGSGSFLLERLGEEVARAARHRLPLSCVLFRVRAHDGRSGDRATHAATLLARLMVRDDDVVAELGCGHFGIVANSTGDGARILAEVLIRELQAFEFTDRGQQVALEVAFGVSEHEDGKSPAVLLEEARAALDQQKRSPELQEQH
ncbi:MAG: GGDEF domain-containing protein [bacterium]